MGGLALKHCTVRQSAAEYQEKLGRLLPALAETLGVPCVPIPAYRSKDSFGDADILIQSDELSSDWIGDLAKRFGLCDGQIVQNSNCLSFAFEMMQVDLICTKAEVFRSSYVYFSYNDLHNLIGRIGHKLGIKIGHDGLFLIIRPNDDSPHIIGAVLLSREVTDVYPLLGLSVDRYLAGFDTLEEIFDFVASSKYFNPDIFLLDNRNAQSRVRDAKRATYSKFLKYCSDHATDLGRFEFETVREHGGYSIREPYYSDLILKQWPEAKEKVDSMISQYEKKQEFAKSYNGVLVGALTGLEGKYLGKFMAKLKSSFDELDYWLNHPNEISNKILEEFEEFKKEVDLSDI